VTIALDASLALAWLFERESTNEAELASSVLETLAEGEALVPALWHAEVVNALLVGERRGGVSEARVADYLQRLARLPIHTDDVPPSTRREGVLALARAHALSAYDAAYLNLALRRDLALATFDRKLVEAMREAGGAVFGDR